MRRVITVAVVLVWVLLTIAVPAYSSPVIIQDWAFIDNRSTNDIWGITGLRLDIGVQATDSGGKIALTGPGSSETAVSSNPDYPFTQPVTLSLDLSNPVAGGAQFVRFPIISINDFSKVTGTYTFTVTNTSSQSTTSTSYDLDKPDVIELPMGLTFSDSTTTPVFTFTDPDPTPGFTALVRRYRMDIFDDTKTKIFQSDWLTTPSFTVPDGILEPGMEYFFRAISGDIDTTDPLITIHSRLENRATEWEEFNTAPIPEPATMLLLGSGLLGVVGYGRKKFFKK